MASPVHNQKRDDRVKAACERFFDIEDASGSIDELLQEFADVADDVREFISEHNRLREIVGTEPTKIGRYVVGPMLGAGSMGTVYQAFDVTMNRDVALKICTPKTGTAEEVARFKREVETLAALRHPGICTIHGVEQTDEHLYFTMELVRGESLQRTLQSGRLGWQEAVDIAVSVAETLAFVHDNGFIHRDVKPSNILLGNDGRIVLSDFGLSVRPADTDSRLTSDGTIIGTPAYMSPEQTRGESDLTPQSDQYALGCVLYEMLTGQPPFGECSQAEAVASVLKSEPLRPRTLHRDIPRSVERVCLQAMSKQPEDRFVSSQEFVAALNNAARNASRQGRGVLAGGLTLLSLVILVIVVVQTRDSENDSPAVPESIPAVDTDHSSVTAAEQTVEAGQRSRSQRAGGIDLTEGLATGEVTKKGRWSRDGTTILIEPGSQPQGVTLTATSPVEYDFTFTVVRREQPKPGMRGLVLFLRLPGDRFTRLFVDNPDYSQFFGNRPDALILSGKILGRVLSLNEPVPVRCEVRANRATCYVSDKPVIEYRGDFEPFPHKDDGGIGAPVLLVGSLGEKFEVREPRLFKVSNETEAN